MDLLEIIGNGNILVSEIADVYWIEIGYGLGLVWVATSKLLIAPIVNTY
jgi:hypothetical protein